MDSLPQTSLRPIQSTFYIQCVCAKNIQLHNFDWDVWGKQTAESRFECGCNKLSHYKTRNIILNSKLEVWMDQQEGKDSMKVIYWSQPAMCWTYLLGEWSIKKDSWVIQNRTWKFLGARRWRIHIMECASFVKKFL
jgi:hypothetical protein